MAMKQRALGLVLAMAFGGGCGGDSNDLNTVAYSGPVTINLDKFKDGEVRNNAFDVDKSVSTEPGNPYGMFLQAATRALGRAPAAVLVDRVTLTLAGDARGVTAMEQFLGPGQTLYLSSSSTTVNLGTVSPTGAGPVEVQLTATRDTLDPLRAVLVAGGGFKVGMRGPAAAGRPSSFDAKVSVVLYFRALIN